MYRAGGRSEMKNRKRRKRAKINEFKFKFDGAVFLLGPRRQPLVTSNAVLGLPDRLQFFSGSA